MLIDEIKSDRLKFRKDRNETSKVSAKSLTTLIGELERIGKDNGNRKTSDSECIDGIAKYVKKIDEMIEITSSEEFKKEKILVSKYLPVQLTNDELEEIIKTYYKNGLTTIKDLTTNLKKEYVGRYNGKEAFSIIKSII